ncbi:response regulator transcription factor [Amycolatopsis sp. NPDC021455]|uniref:response regulator transcription factor n=1 Tax=Amycolatopsis sp. NPDC021455 TaxID=3154901 RepID=UPI0033D15D7E
MDRIRVLLADDEHLLRAGIRLVLRHADDIEVVAEAGDGGEAVDLACRLALDVALLDIRMPGVDGLTAAEQLARRAPALKVVMLTTFGEPGYVSRALRAGAAGFVLKDTGPQELIQAVRAAARGGAVLSPRIAKDLIDTYVVTDDGEARRLVGTLTAREHEVLVGVGLGMSNAEIARQLFMGEGTVKTYVSRILGKLGRDNRVQAAIVAHEAGILPAG